MEPSPRPARPHFATVAGRSSFLLAFIAFIGPFLVFKMVGELPAIRLILLIGQCVIAAIAMGLAVARS